MFVITDPSVIQMMLSNMIRTIDENGMDTLLKDGFEPEFIDAMRHQKVRDINYVSRSSAIEFKLQFDQKKVLAACRRCEYFRIHCERQEYFVRNGASNKTIARLFKMSDDTVRELRKYLMTKNIDTGGRPALPPENERIKVSLAWNKYQSLPSRSDRVYQLHYNDFPQYSIEALIQTLHEFGDDVFYARAA